MIKNPTNIKKHLVNKKNLLKFAADILERLPAAFLFTQKFSYLHRVAFLVYPRSKIANFYASRIDSYKRSRVPICSPSKRGKP